MTPPIDRNRGGTEEFLRSLNRRIVAERVPVSGSIELTHRCNLGCRHCFLRGGTRDGELSAAEWKSLLDQAADAGCMNLLISGGEPFLRPDFAAIYRHCRERGLLTTVFTNGTLVTDEICSLFRDLKPQLVEVSVYGATEETMEAVTGVRGALARCRRGIERLLDAGVPVALKTMLLEANREEWQAIRSMAEAYGVDYRTDGAVFACSDGDRGPLDCRVSPAEAVGEEFSDPVRLQRWREYFDRMKVLPEAEGLFTCAAGRTHFHIDPVGSLLPCLMAREPSYNLRQGAFLDGWNGVIAALGEMEADESYPCNGCEERSLCGLCPFFFERENGSPAVPASYLCELGRERRKALEGNCRKSTESGIMKVKV